MTPSISSMSLSSSYDSYLDRSIVNAVREGAHDLWHLISVLPGFYPTLVREAVARLIRNSVIPEGISDEAPQTDPAPHSQLEVPGLPVPHPLDFDWRFTRGTAGVLLGRLDALSRSATPVALLGTPSVYVLAKRQRLAHKFILLDQNDSLANSEACSSSGGRHYCCDLMDRVPNLPLVHTVLADPPWYVDDAMAFLRVASQISAKGATILLSFGPDGMRPGIPGERKRLIAEAEAMGLHLTGISHLTLSYATPFFERNALHAAGFTQVAPAWRRGDLLAFQKVSDPYSPRHSANGDNYTWAEVSIDRVRFRVRQRGIEGFADPRLAQLVPGDILPTVSRRDGRRQRVDVWTSGNRVYGSTGTHILTVLLHAIRDSESPTAAVQRLQHQPMDDVQIRLVESTVLQVKQIVQAEGRDMKDFADALR